MKKINNNTALILVDVQKAFLDKDYPGFKRNNIKKTRRKLVFEKTLCLYVIYRKTCIFASLFLRAIINIFIQVIFPNIITYLDRTFKEEQNNHIDNRDITLT